MGAKIIDRLARDLRQSFPAMRESIRQGWSRSVLELQLLGNAYQRCGKAMNNFGSSLPAIESRRAAEVFKDPYLFDFLGAADLHRERQIEQALVEHGAAAVGAADSFRLAETRSYE